MTMPESTIQYFAYGSNLCPRQIVKRCPSTLAIGVAVLHHHRLVFPRYSHNWQCGVAGVEPSEGQVVEGVVYQMNRSCIETLDRHEGVHAGRYRRDMVNVQNTDGSETQCAIYMATFEPDGHYPPDGEYLGTMLRGAQYHGLSERWIAHLKRFADTATSSTVT